MSVQIYFKDVEQNTSLRCLPCDEKKITLLIEYYQNDNLREEHVNLDKYTAIRLVRELKKQIGLIEY